MGRTKKFNEKSKVLTIRVPESQYNTIKSTIENIIENKYVSENDPEDTLDTLILKKMIPEFIKYDIEIELDNNEIERVKSLYAEI